MSCEWSAVGAVRAGRWREWSAGPLAVLALVAAALDVATTTVIFLSPDYWEGNVLFASLGDVWVPLAVVAFAAVCAGHVALAWASLGWLSVAGATVTLASMGSGGVNNLVLFATGSALYQHLGWDYVLTIHYVQPTVGVLLGVGWVTLVAREPPYRELLVGAGGYLLVAYGIGLL